MVSHGNSVQSFLEICDPDARSKSVIGVDYCCISIAKCMTDAKWNSEMLGNAKHIGLGNSEVIPFDF